MNPLDRTQSRRTLGLGIILGCLTILVYTNQAEAAQPAPPTTTQVTHRMGRATSDMLDRKGMRVDGLVSASCRPGTKSDPTRKVRWWCLLEQRDELGEVVWRSRVRLRWHRGSAKTVVTWRMEGIIRMTSPSTGFLSSERF